MLKSILESWCPQVLLRNVLIQQLPLFYKEVSWGVCMVTNFRGLNKSVSRVGWPFPSTEAIKKITQRAIFKSLSGWRTGTCWTSGFVDCQWDIADPDHNITSHKSGKNTTRRKKCHMAEKKPPGGETASWWKNHQQVEKPLPGRKSATRRKTATRWEKKPPGGKTTTSGEKTPPGGKTATR